MKLTELAAKAINIIYERGRVAFITENVIINANKVIYNFPASTIDLYWDDNYIGRILYSEGVTLR